MATPVVKMDKEADKTNRQAEPEPLQQEDYYLNGDGLLVFTAAYHLKRGYCCGNKCRHCPFGWGNVKKAIQDE